MTLRSRGARSCHCAGITVLVAHRWSAHRSDCSAEKCRLGMGVLAMALLQSTGHGLLFIYYLFGILVHLFGLPVLFQLHHGATIRRSRGESASAGLYPSQVRCRGSGAPFIRAEKSRCPSRRTVIVGTAGHWPQFALDGGRGAGAGYYESTTKHLVPEEPSRGDGMHHTTSARDPGPCAPQVMGLQRGEESIWLHEGEYLVWCATFTAG